MVFVVLIVSVTFSKGAAAVAVVVVEGTVAVHVMAPLSNPIGEALSQLKVCITSITSSLITLPI